MKLTLNMSGMMAMPSALRSTSRGIPVFGLRVISLKTSSDSATVASGFFWAWATRGVKVTSRVAKATFSPPVDVFTMT